LGSATPIYEKNHKDLLCCFFATLIPAQPQISNQWHD